MTGRTTPEDAAFWTPARTHPFTYPGARPAGSFVLVHDEVVPLTGDTGGDPASLGAGGRPLSALLDAAGLAPVRERVPVLTYGANANPGTVLIKLRHHGRSPVGPGTLVPVLAAGLSGFDAVAGGLSQQGYLYADLHEGPGTARTGLAVHVMLLDEEQLHAMHDSERVRDGNYHVGVVDVALEGGTPMRAMAYVGRRPVFRSPTHGRPIALNGVAATGRELPAYDTVPALAHALVALGLREHVVEETGLEPGATAEAAAREVMRVLNGQWWYRHHTGDARAARATRLEDTIVAALRAHPEERAPAQAFAARGALLDVENAYRGRV